MPGPAPTESQEPAEEFEGAVEVRVVNVDVFVRDRDGRPVTDLTREDFELRVDGRPTPLSNFYAVTEHEPTSVAARPSPEPSGEPAEPATGATASDTPPPAPLPTWLVVYLDNAHIKAMHRTRVLRDVRAFLYEDGRQFDQILLASYEGGLHIRQAFTEDPELVVRALGEIGTLQPFGDAREDELHDLIRELEDRKAPRGWLANRVEAYAQQRQNELKRALVPLRDLIDSLAGLNGRKALLYVSDGLPMNPGEELFNALQLRFDDIGSLQGIVHYTAAQDFERLAMAASAAEVTMYTLDATGLAAPLAGSAEVVGSGVDNLRATVGAVRTSNLQAPLRKLAGETGGLAFLNSNRFGDELDRLVDDARAYYSLGFRPPHGADGRFHRIDVRVRRKGIVVRHRNGYRDEPIETRLENAVQAALRWGAAENPLGVEVRAAGRSSGDAAGSGDHTRVVSVDIAVPLDSLVLLERGTDRVGRIRLALAVRDREGGSSPIQRLEVPITIPAESYAPGRGQRYVHELEMRVRPGPHRIAVSVWDNLGQEGATAVTRFNVDG